MSGRVAVVLFNLGGPDGLEAVEPFLFNLFNDPAIIGTPSPARWLLARFISKCRAPTARRIYGRIGGRSPLLELTRGQAAALESQLRERGMDVRAFVCMRYWHPMSAEVANEVAAFSPDEVVLLPLYPQFSSTTSASSLAEWRHQARRAGIGGSEYAVCCYPIEDGLVAAHVRLLRSAIAKMGVARPPRVLFSAHGLPKRVVDGGDPYQWQVEASVEKIVRALAIPNLDYVVCYQSRVGPLEWIGPQTEEELEQAGRDGVPVIVDPIAFVSEHSETLVELDIEYSEKAQAFGVPAYSRVPAVGTAPEFISGLGALVEGALAREPGTYAAAGGRLCPADFGRCPCAQ